MKKLLNLLMIGAFVFSFSVAQAGGVQKQARNKAKTSQTKSETKNSDSKIENADSSKQEATPADAQKNIQKKGVTKRARTKK